MTAWGESSHATGPSTGSGRVKTARPAPIVLNSSAVAIRAPPRRVTEADARRVPAAMHPRGRTGRARRSVPGRATDGPYDAPMRPTALLLDYAGVMTEDMWASVGGFCVRHGIAPERLAGAYRPGADFYELSVELECGRVSVEDFEPRLAAVLGLDDHTDLVQRLVGGLGVEPRMVEVVAAARAAGVRTVLLSNSWGEAMYAPEVRALCDAEVLSGRVGIRKPSPEIYAMAVEAAGVAASDCVFVDDQEVNLPPARALGITAVHHTDADATVAELRRLLHL
ncbi:HAD-IA family hydrolase [Conexibacter sp. W3-3-2]|nr:HAD-IA family hydrolase [Conexibacter sp. W3-3-2]